MKRPMFIAFICMASGIIIGNIWQGMVTAALAFFILLLVARVFYKECRYKGVWVLPLFFIAGYLLMSQSLKRQEAIRNFIISNPTEIRASGRVLEYTVYPSGYTVATIRLNEICTAEERIKRAYKVQAIFNHSEIAIGQEICITGVFIEPEKARNPGGFNELNYYRARKIDLKIFPTAIKTGKVHKNVYFYLKILNQRFSSVYDAILPQRERGFIKSMIIGDSLDLDPSMKNLYRTVGIYHIIVISGLHIAILIGVTEKIFGYFIGVRAGSVGALVFALVYCLFTGASISTVRAVTMAGVAIIGKLFYRDSETVSSAAFTGLCLMAYEPYYIFDIGFQLSFGAVFGIGFLSRPLSRWIDQLYKNKPSFSFIEKFDLLKSGFVVSLSAFLFTAPITAYHFNSVPLYSVFINMLIVPLSSVIVILGFLSGCLGLYSLSAGAVFSDVICAIIGLYDEISLFFFRLPFGSILVKTYPVALVLLYYVPLLLFIYLKGRKKISASVAALVLLMGSILSYEVYRYHLATITMLDVGQGDAFVIEYKGSTVVIDGGGIYGKELGENTGAEVLIPYLNHQGIDRVDLVIASHMDNDHTFGIIELLDGKKVSQLGMPYTVDRENHLYKALSEQAEENGVSPQYLVAGDSIMLQESLSFEVLHPGPENISTDANETSLVLQGSVAGVTILFTGDIGFEAEAILLEKGYEMKSTVLKISHHGSKNASGEDFLKNVQPHVALIGASKNNRYGHPSEEVIERLLSQEIPYFVTGNRGAVILTCKKGRIKARCML